MRCTLITDVICLPTKSSKYQFYAGPNFDFGDVGISSSAGSSYTEIRAAAPFPL